MPIGIAKKEELHFSIEPRRLNPAKTQFLLIGVSSFSMNQTLPGVLNDIANLKRTLISPVVGLPEKNVEVLLNPQSDVILKNIKALVKKKDMENLFIYFSGTSTINEDKVFALACNPKVKAENSYDLLPITAVDEALGDTTANVIAFFDCCHSQAAFTHLYVENFFIMTAASVDAVTYELMIEGEQRGVFTHYIIKALEEGIDNGKEWITLSDLYTKVREMLAKAPEGIVTEPKMMTTNMVSFLEIAKNNINIKKPEPVKLPTLSAFQLKSFVAEDELGKALQQMMEAAHSNNDLLNGIVNLKNQLTDYENKKILQLYFEQEAIVIKNRLTASILGTIDICKQQGVLAD